MSTPAAHGPILPDSPCPIDPRARALSPSATLAINERSARLQREGKRILRLGLGQSPFPVPECVRQALAANAHQKDYLPVAGLEPLRQEVADYHRRVHGIDRRADDVLIAPGSKELMFILQLVFDGDVLLPRPSWVSYAPQAGLTGRRVEWLATDDGGLLDPDTLEQACRREPDRPRLLILNTPSNPTGMAHDDPRLRELATVARRHRVLLLSDEIYGELHHEGRHRSPAVYYPEGTIVSSGLSKWCGAGGWRLGTFLFPPELHRIRQAMAAVASETYTSTSAPIQHAAIRAFRGGPEIDDYLARSRLILKALGRAIASRMREAGIRVGDPEGGFYLMPDFTPLGGRLAAAGIATSTGFCERLLQETGVAMLPGSCFGFGEQSLNARLAYVDFDGAAALAAVDPNAASPPDPAFLNVHCGRVVEAIDLLCSWLEALPDGNRHSAS